MKISDEKLNEWKLLIDERKQRGLRVDEFCKEKNITIPQFYYYHKQVNKNQNTKTSATSKPNIKPLQIINNTTKESAIRIILPNSMRCVLPLDLDISNRSPHVPWISMNDNT
ncbi:MAG: hypothetical protein JO131_03615 [Gammaproteobacteria bacterium]|nr:hypothetical protein [Gammaproteobacteria bacterium]